MNKNHKGKILAVATILSVLLTVAYYWNAGKVSADSEIEWTPVPVTEVLNIANVDFLYTDNGICWGITYNGGEWVVETITGEYDIERLNNMVDFSDSIGCKRIS